MNDALRSTWHAWVRLLDTRESATSLAACRIVAAATMLVTLAHAWWSGVAEVLWVHVDYGGANRARSAVFELFGGASWPHVRTLLLVGMCTSTLLLVGAFTRVAAIACWLSFRVLAAANPWSGGSGDDVLSNALLLLCVSGAGRCWSIDARLFAGSREVPAWPRYLAIGQLVAIYTSAGWHKLSIAWIPGGPLDAVWYTLQNPIWQRRPMLWLAPYGWLTQLVTLATWCFEISAPVLLLAFYYRATANRPGRLRRAFNRWDLRAKYLLFGLCMHLGIEASMEVGAFFGAMLSLYVCCVHPSEWRRAIVRATGTLGTS